MFTPVDQKVSLSELEEKTIAYWKKNKTFEKSIEQRSPEKKWTFLDGPPFVTGKPHYGSLLSSLPKDVFGRYYTMKGFQVRRVWGWDGHGLPIENKVEGELELKSKREIEEKVGVKTFIERCLHYVNQISGEWEWYVDHIGRWVDFKNAYRTWDMPYMESVMWIFHEMYTKGYIYKGLKNSLYCPHCATPISNFEVAMDADNYKEVTDPSTMYKYELVRDSGSEAGMTGLGKTYILAWSTTPWTKIPTLALAINPKLTYVKIKQGDEQYILAKSTVKMLTPRHSGLDPESPQRKKKILNQVQDDVDYEIVEEFSGEKLIGKKYIPHFNFFTIDPTKKSFEIIGDNFVTAEEGTGVVTIAAYGEEDLKVMQDQNVQIEMHLDEEGNVKKEIPQFGGMYYLKANKAVNEDLASRGLIYKDAELSHRVPLCWRCHTRLYYAAIDAWYVHVQDLKKKMKETNEMVNWFPQHFKHGRFEKSLEHAPDWNISRNRYWGSPVPVWECACSERFVPGSVAELEERSGRKITNLHKPEIDEVTVKCEKCGKEVHRVPEVLDSWIEAGSASFAERHYPFNTEFKLEDFFPPDYIAEYTGQIRAWFYVLHVIGAALYGSQAFKNVSVTGVILGTDGRKMSKNFKNYPDPKEMLEKYGGDALRLYLLGSPVMHGEDILISEEQYKNQVRGMLLILWNTYNFFILNAIADGWERTKKNDKKSKNILDEWILTLLQTLVADVTKQLDSFDTVAAIDSLKKFVDDFSTWYVRRSRDRVGPAAENQEDKDAFYQTSYVVLTTFCQLLAPIAPFISEEIYRNLTGEESVHLTDWPEWNQESRNKNQELLTKMELARKMVQEGHAKRKIDNTSVKQPLEKLPWHSGEVNYSKLQDENEIMKLVLDELNTFNISISGKFVYPKAFKNVSADELEAMEDVRRIVRSIQQERKTLGTTVTEKVHVALPAWPKEFEEYIKKKALVGELSVGEFKVTKIE